MDTSGIRMWFNRNYDFKNSVHDFSVTKLYLQSGVDRAKE